MDVRERFLMDPEFHAACVATKRQAEKDGGWLDPEMVAKVLMAFDRSEIGSLTIPAGVKGPTNGGNDERLRA